VCAASAAPGVSVVHVCKDPQSVFEILGLVGSCWVLLGFVEQLTAALCHSVLGWTWAQTVWLLQHASHKMCNMSMMLPKHALELFWGGGVAFIAIAHSGAQFSMTKGVLYPGRRQPAPHIHTLSMLREECC
jgi:hypothetical protein